MERALTVVCHVGPDVPHAALEGSTPLSVPPPALAGSATTSPTGKNSEQMTERERERERE